MNVCPHCGAGLRDNARFCPACMTPLNQKRVVPTPKYFPLRWLSGTAAVLVLLAAVWSAGHLRPREEEGKNAVTPAVTTTTQTAATADSTTATEVQTTTDGVTADNTTLTTLAEAFGEQSTTTTVKSHTQVTYDTTGRVPPFLTTTRGTTLSTQKTTTTTATTTTTTTKKTTTTTTTRPYWENATPGAFTEDGLPIEEVTWTYEPITSSSLGFYRCKDTDYPNISGNSTSRTATPSGVPVNQCIKVTGCIGTTSNGIYRVPAMIDGKTVAVVDFGDTFADKSVALTVKRIYLPPDALRFQGGIENCTKLEGLYMTSPDFWLYPDHVPDCGTYSWGGVTYYNLTLYVPPKFNPIYIQYYSPYVWLYACKGNVYDAESDHLTDQQCQALYGVAAA